MRGAIGGIIGAMRGAMGGSPPNNQGKP